MIARSRASWIRFLALLLLGAIWWPIVILFAVTAATGGCVGPCPPRSPGAERVVRGLEILVAALPVIGLILVRRWWTTWFPNRPFPSFGRGKAPR